ncbi:MAG: ABC transporter ATP-binding protein [Gammaproteobacteria bacterium]
MAAVVFDGVGKVYDGGHRAVDGVSLAVEDGELMVLVGPSGCGKSTLMRMAAGLEEISEGEIRIGARVVNDIPPQERNVAMIFQNYALYPHLTVRGNLAFPLRMRGLARGEIDRRVRSTASMLDLTDLLERRPKALSGGQRQRVAMGRAIIRDADVFLMDEPLSNLDAKLRVKIRGEIAALQSRLGITTLYVTHDQAEAMTLGRRVAVLRDGRLQQAAAPRELYERPANIFVAGFIGSPGMNVLRASMESQDGKFYVRLGECRLALPGEALASFPGIQGGTGRELLVGVRPSAIALAGENDSGGLPGSVRAAEFQGHETLLHVDSSARTVADDTGVAGVDAETVPPALAVLLPGHHPLRRGEVLRLKIDAAGLCFFGLDGRTLAHRE